MYVPVESEVPGIVPISGMNQTLIHKAENMREYMHPSLQV